MSITNSVNTKTDVLIEPEYVRKSAMFINKCLGEGCDVTQMPNGDIFVTEVKTITLQYKWDSKKGKMVRINNGGRMKKNKTDKSGDLLNSDELMDDLIEESVE